MSSKKSITTYAKALFQNFKVSNSNVPKEVDLSDIGKIILREAKTKSPDVFFLGEELLLVRALILSSKSINEFFQNPTYSEHQKLDVLFSIFPGLTLSFQSFLKVLAEKSHLSLLPEISLEYTKILVNFRNSTDVKIYVANGLKENYGVLLLNTLRTVTNSKEIIVSAFYNPKLLGGFILEYNSKSIDASILKEFSFFLTEG